MNQLCNIEVERGVLGSLLLDNSLIPRAKDIKASFFTTGTHNRLFLEILACHKNEKPADLITLKSTNTETLAEMMDFVPTTANFESYKTMLVDAGVKRELLKATDDIRSKILNSTDISSDVLKTEVLDLLNGVKVEGTTEDISCMGDLILDCVELLERKHNDKSYKFRNWGIKWLDEKTGGVKPALTYLAARPSIGKTAFALQIAKSVAKQGGKVAIFSLEMDKQSVANRMICNAGGVNKDYFDKNIPIPKDTWVEIGKASATLAELPIFIYDKFFSIEEILLTCETQRLEHGLDFMVLDYIQLCETNQKHLSTNDRVSYISRQLKKYQQKTGIHVLALSQFNRETEAKKYPTLSNLRDSGSLEQDANNVLFLHEESDKPEDTAVQPRELMLVIAKQREGERNICKKLKFYGSTQRFYE